MTVHRKDRSGVDPDVVAAGCEKHSKRVEQLRAAAFQQKLDSMRRTQGHSHEVAGAGAPEEEEEEEEEEEAHPASPAPTEVMASPVDVEDDDTPPAAEVCVPTLTPQTAQISPRSHIGAFSQDEVATSEAADDAHADARASQQVHVQ